ncbi:universal stress protein [Egbenema bharatensis]|uniref:universal stress protein n=1 Tax=Egbenema bharatensis TaxID=3463334 RepID=UPI003A8B6BB0
MGYQRILVAIDRSSQAPIVFEQALEQMQGNQACLMIAHTVRVESEISTGAFMGLGTIADVDTYNTMKRLHQERIQKQLDQAEEWLQSYYQQAIEQGIPTEVDCHAGEPAVWICELARTWNADLIVVGRRGHQGIKEIVLGSVSNYVIHHAPCSVLIVQGMTFDQEEYVRPTHTELTL